MKSNFRQIFPLSARLTNWLLVVLLMGVAAAFKLHFYLAGNYLLMGSDGAYYPLQVRSLLAHLRLALPDMPLLFLMEATLAQLFQWLEIGSLNESIILAVKFLDIFLPPLAAIPVFLIAKELETTKQNTWFLTYLMITFSILNYTPITVFPKSLLLKNALAVVWIFFYLYFSLRVVKYKQKKDAYYLFFTLVLCFFTHFGSFSILLLFSGVLSLCWIFSSKTIYSNIHYPKIIATIILLASLFISLYFIDYQRFQRLLSISSKLFEIPVFLLVLNGHTNILNPMVFLTMILVNALVVFAFFIIWANQASIEKPVKIVGLALAIFSLILASPLLGLEWANRLYIMSYIPLSVLYLIFFKMPISQRIKNFPAILLLCLLSMACFSRFFEPPFQNMTQEAFTEFEKIDHRIVLDSSVMVIGRQDLRLLSSWIFSTKSSADYLFTEDDFKKYNAIYVIKQIKGSILLLSARYRQIDIPANAPKIYQGEYFELYQLEEMGNWKLGKGKPIKARGTIININKNQLILDGQSLIKTIKFSNNTAIHLLNRGNKFAKGMYVEVWGEWQPFGLAVNATLINETKMPN